MFFNISEEPAASVFSAEDYFTKVLQIPVTGAASQPLGRDRFLTDEKRRDVFIRRKRDENNFMRRNSKWKRLDGLEIISWKKGQGASKGQCGEPNFLTHLPRKVPYPP
jgi:hypothetical protein